MATHISAIPDNRGWKQTYHAAIVEKDHYRMIHCIAIAMDRLSQRERELFHTFAKAKQIPKNYSLLMEELEAINDATYLLKALFNSASRDVAGEW